MALSLVFLVLAVLGVAHHELWRDEWQAWMVARDSPSIAALIANLRHEGNPPTWHLILYLLSRVTRDPVAMQAVHVAIATTSVYLFARFAPLPALQKVLATFGYFLLYEYTVVARHYALGVLALFTFCALLSSGRRLHPIPLVLVLFFLAATSVFGLILSLAAGGLLLLEMVIRARRRGSRWLQGPWLALSAAAWTGGLVLATVAIRPPRGFLAALTLEGAFSRWSLATSASTLTRAYLPLPDLSDVHLWNTFFIDTGGTAALAVMLGTAVAMGVAAVLLFLRKPAVLFLYVAGTGGLLLFHHLIFPGMLRHQGHLFLLFLACLWLARLPLHEWRLPAWLDRRAGPRPVTSAVVTAILLFQVTAAGLLYVADLRRPFTAAPAVAAFIRGRGLDDLPLAVSPAPAGSSVAGALDRPLHFLALRENGTFVPWERYPRPYDRYMRMELIRPFLQEAGPDVLVLLGRPIEDWDPGLRVQELASFPAGLEQSETYVLYRVAQPAP